MRLPHCPHCHRPFVPEVHNAWHQQYCTREACQRARNRVSCRSWRARNPSYHHDDTQRTREWRRSHPGYWREERRKVFTVDLLLPVHGTACDGVGVRIRDPAGSTLQHVVIRKCAGWPDVGAIVGTTLQNLVHETGSLRLSLVS